MMVLGADPDVEPNAWPEPVAVPFMRPDVYELTSYFSYHNGMRMSQRNDDADKMILARLFSMRLHQGYTMDSLKGMVDRFYQSYAKDYVLPALAFASKQMQNTLTREAEVVKDDPVLKWLLDGMPDVGPFTEPKEMRRAVLTSSTEFTHRYPDLLADVLRVDDTPEGTVSRLAAAEFEWTRSLKSVKDARPRYDTMQQAIAAIPIDKKVNW